MKIEVTQKHIDEGLEYMDTTDRCVVARAVQDSLGDSNAGVGLVSAWTFHNGLKSYHLPYEVREFIRQCISYSGHSRTFIGRWIFGDDRPKPFSFELK